MAKKENLQFLASIYSADPKRTIISLDDYDALLTWLFGDERTIAVCARLAYTDLKQAPLAGIGKMPAQDKKAFIEDVIGQIERCLNDLFARKVSEREAFDAWHKETCEKICEVSNKHDIPKWVKWMKNGFTYGNAQKWLNMTIKNMLVMEQWDEDLYPIKMLLHVPVDDYIKKAAWKLKIKLPRSNPLKNGETLGAYSVSKAWSRWDYSDYINFQEELRKALESQCPMDWEFDAFNKTKTKLEDEKK